MIDDIDSIKYDKENYNCVHFLIDIYKHYNNVDLAPSLLIDNQFKAPLLRNFKPTTLKNNVIVLFRSRNENHVGLFIDNRVIHLTEHGVRCQLLAIAKSSFQRVEYYEKK